MIMGVFLVILYLCAILTFIWIFAYLLKQKVMEPINRLTTGLRKITSGDRTARLTGRINVEFEEMQDAFNYMAGQLEEAENAKEAYERERSMIFSNISHDLKTPISTIAGYAGALSEGLVTDEKKKDEYLRAIRAKALHMNELVELLFEYSRLDNPQYTIRREKIELTELLRSVLAAMYGEFEARSVTLDIDLPDESVDITGDRLELSRAVTNLLNNALLHNAPGRRVRVCLAGESGTPDGNTWEIRISDDGDPIPEELAARLFTPFVVGDESRSTRGGSGLGLAITRKIVERHGGRAVLRQGPEGYTKTFAILLPADPPVLPAAAGRMPDSKKEDSKG
jgi:signal transduction histidine kinase